MNKRIKNEKLKNQMVKFAVKVNIADELKEDSIAHKIKNYFELDSIQNKMLFKWDKEKKKLLISKKHIMYLISLCNDVETLKSYDMEIVDEINPLSE